MFIVHQSTFFINSLAHLNMDLFNSKQPYGDSTTAHDSLFCALLTWGEGYHNFHHEFPNDYRNAIKWYQYDPTKWVILILEALGFATDLNRLHEKVIEHSKISKEVKDHEARLA